MLVGSTVGIGAGEHEMNRDVQAVILFALAVAGLTVSFNGAYAAYVKPSLLPYLIASCVALLVLAIAPYVAELRRATRSAPHDHADHGDADHEHSIRVAWLLLLPTLVLMLIAPPALGAAAAEGDSGVVSADDLELAGLPPIPDGDPAEVTLLDVATRAGFPDVGVWTAVRSSWSASRSRARTAAGTSPGSRSPAARRTPSPSRSMRKALRHLPRTRGSRWSARSRRPPSEPRQRWRSTA